MPIVLTTQAYCKMLLHAAKYPHCAVNGLLVAEKVKEHKKEPSAPVLCVDCVPLFHGTLALAPMLEVALTLVSTWMMVMMRHLKTEHLNQPLFSNYYNSYTSVVLYISPHLFYIHRSILGARKIDISLLGIIRPMSDLRTSGKTFVQTDIHAYILTEQVVIHSLLCYSKCLFVCFIDLTRLLKKLPPG